MPDLAFILKVSRPRFWIYLLGPYLVGLVAAISTRDELLTWHYAVFAVYFTLPANLLVYGVNDICDYETDKLNPKKANYEALVTPERRKTILLAILLLNLPFVAGLIYVPLVAINSLVAFLLLSIFYSAWPIRAKAKPLLDSAFNVLYIMPGFFANAMISGELPPWQAVVAGGLWTAAMHAYSAVPDIEVDREAGLNTIATVLGANLTVALCALLYLASAFLAAEFLGFIAVPLGFAYLLLMLASFWSIRNGRIFKLYRAFPLINMSAGFLIFWSIASSKLL
ncbi:MAG TPA: prenyltransferase [Pyrinomonadaceae bacterium]|nr:prenyltransferase [Pyrinomonadaceae bacterium]